MSYLLDTNVISELRKGQRADHGVIDWITEVPDDLYLSVLVLGELRRGIQLIRRRDRPGADALDGWLRQVVEHYADRILPVSAEVADAWGRMGVPDPVPVIDGLLAATALVHDLTLVTRNIGDVATTGVSVLNPFTSAN